MLTTAKSMQDASSTGPLHDAFVKFLDDRSRLDISTIAHEHAHGGHDVNTFTILRREPIRAVALTLAGGALRPLRRRLLSVKRDDDEAMAADARA